MDWSSSQSYSLYRWWYTTGFWGSIFRETLSPMDQWMKKHESLEKELGYHSTHGFRGVNMFKPSSFGSSFWATACYDMPPLYGHDWRLSAWGQPSPGVKIHYFGINTVASIAKSCGSHQRIPAKWCSNSGLKRLELPTAGQVRPAPIFGVVTLHGYISILCTFKKWHGFRFNPKITATSLSQPSLTHTETPMVPNFGPFRRADLHNLFGTSSLRSKKKDHTKARGFMTQTMG